MKALDLVKDFRQARGRRVWLTLHLEAVLGIDKKTGRARAMVLPQRRSDECLGSWRN